jgi:hypothetical protein
MEIFASAKIAVGDKSPNNGDPMADLTRTTLPQEYDRVLREIEQTGQFHGLNLRAISAIREENLQRQLDNLVSVVVPDQSNNINIRKRSILRRRGAVSAETTKSPIAELSNPTMPVPTDLDSEMQESYLKLIASRLDLDLLNLRYTDFELARSLIDVRAPWIPKRLAEQMLKAFFDSLRERLVIRIEVRVRTYSLPEAEIAECMCFTRFMVCCQ